MTDAAKRPQQSRPARTEALVREVKESMAGQLISAIYRDRIRPMRTRSYQLSPIAKKNHAEILQTLLGIELKIGKRRLLCPDLATARYLSVFARLGVESVAVPYDITQISRLADELESAWFRMLTLIDHLTADSSERLRSRVQSRLILDERAEVTSLGAGPAIPQFNQNTKQRKGKS
jgi:hypothetical protein